MKKALSILVVTMILLSLTAGAGFSEIKSVKAGMIWYVDASAPTGGNGTQSQPFQTIMAAVNAASGGDTIKVDSGTYTEQIVINKDLTIIGENGATIERPDTLVGYKVPGDDNNTYYPIVLAYGGTTSGNNPITINNDGKIIVNISGIKVNGEWKCNESVTVGIMYCNASGVISNNSIVRMMPESELHGNMGIFVYGDFNVEVTENNVFKYSEAGICIAGNLEHTTSSYATVTNNTVNADFYNTVNADVYSTYQNGIEFVKATGTITNNTVLNNANKDTQNNDSFLYAGCGILVGSSSGVDISGNKISYNNMGISVIGSTDFGSANNNKISGNAVSINLRGIGVVGPANNTKVSGNTVNAGSIDWSVGIVLYSMDGPVNSTVIKDNKINDKYAVLLLGGDNKTTIQSNIITTNWGGIYLGKKDQGIPAKVLIKGNTIDLLGRGCGLEIEKVNNVVVQGNTFMNGKCGIYIGNGTNPGDEGIKVNYNNFEGITGTGSFGIDNKGTDALEAKYNWWGESDKLGPYNPTLNPNGTGCAVSNNVTFDPWVGKAGDKTEGKAEGVTGGTASLNSIDNTFENGTIGMGADVTLNGNGSSDVMLVKYSQNPTSVSFNESFPGAFFDLNATQPANLDKIVLKLYYPANHGNLAPFWFDKTESKWKLCSNWQVVPGSVTVDTCNVDNSSYAGYVAVTIDNTTSPTLSELTGTYFALCGEIITASAGPGGSISPSGNVVVNYGASQTFTITPDAGYMISKIIVDGKAVYVPQTYKATYTFKDVKSNHTIRAKFVKKPKPMFEVTAKVNIFGGYAEVTPKVQAVPSGSPAKVVINPEAGYHITKITDNGVSIPLTKLVKNPIGTYTYTILSVYENHNLIVTLEKDKFVISVKVGKGGTISPSGTLGNVTTYYGENKTFKITPENGYKIEKVLVDGEEVNIKDGEYTFFAVKANHSIEVLFEKVPVSKHQSVVINLKIGSPFITVNGVKKQIDSQGSRPIIKNNRTLLPIRVIIEFLGGTIKWNGKTREVTIELNGHSIVLKIGNSVALVDGIKTKIDPNDSKVVPIIINGRTYLPLRFIAEHLGATVDWDSLTKTVTIYYWL